MDRAWIVHLNRRVREMTNAYMDATAGMGSAMLCYIISDYAGGMAGSLFTLAAIASVTVGLWRFRRAGELENEVKDMIRARLPLEDH